jgi:hypothetical protein
MLHCSVALVLQMYASLQCRTGTAEVCFIAVSHWYCRGILHCSVALVLHMYASLQCRTGSAEDITIQNLALSGSFRFNPGKEAEYINFCRVWGSRSGSYECCRVVCMLTDVRGKKKYPFHLKGRKISWTRNQRSAVSGRKLCPGRWQHSY